MYGKVLIWTQTFIIPYHFIHSIVHVRVINAMCQLFKDLSRSQENDSTWVSKLIVDIPIPSLLIFGDLEISNNIKTSSTASDVSSTDVITLLTKPSAVTESFCSKSYKGEEDFERLKDYLIDCE